MGANEIYYKTVDAVIKKCSEEGFEFIIQEIPVLNEYHIILKKGRKNCCYPVSTDDMTRLFFSEPDNLYRIVDILKQDFDKLCD